MCLYISPRHIKAAGHHRIVTTKDYLVWKRLRRTSGNTSTPPYYYDFEYTFGKQAVSKIRRTGGIVENGLHSYRRRLNFSTAYYGCYPAVIPAGSHIYYGDFGEVVSNKLIVYKSMRQLEAAYE